MHTTHNKQYSIRMGQGYDIHKLTETVHCPDQKNTGILLGGYGIECSYQTIAHSDGDALCHAIADSLLGALALGDIGQYFPSTDPTLCNADSLSMLQYVYKNLIQANGFTLGNLDATVILEKIRLQPSLMQIRKSLLRGLQILDSSIQLDQVSIKAKTKDGIGAVGRGEAIEVFVTSLLYASI